MLVYIILAVFALLLIYIATTYFISSTVIYLDRQPVPKNLGDYGLDFEDITFTTSDQVKIKGWLIPGSTDKLVIITHVGGLTKYGSTREFKSISKLYNKEIEFLKVARHLHDQGYGVLMFDFRNHGESDPSPNGGKAGVGLEEYLDVIAAMQFIAGRDDLRNKDVGFVSFCMGANSTIVAMSKEPEVFKDVKCMVAIQPISMKVFIRTYLGKLFTPVGAKLLMPLVSKFVAWRGKYLLEKMSPADYAQDIKVPTMYVQTKNDPWTDLNDIKGFYAETPAPKEFFWIEGTKHRFEGYQYFGEQPAKMLEWLGKWM
ncbi:MAG: alpha/beta fold hydrolase [Parcubacteria group bacterium]|nr:alpha/beta fold hydrolase [Parcubacteria group bacterium]